RLIGARVRRPAGWRPPPGRGTLPLARPARSPRGPRKGRLRMMPCHTPAAPAAPARWPRRAGSALLFGLAGAAGISWLALAAFLAWLVGRWGVIGWGAEEWAEDGWKVALALAAAAGLLVGLSWAVGAVSPLATPPIAGAALLGAAYGLGRQLLR